MQLPLPFFLLFFLFSVNPSSAHPRLLALLQETPVLNLTYHGGPLLKGNYNVTLIWYGNFTPSQRSILTDLIVSLGYRGSPPVAKPRISRWWAATAKYKYRAATAPTPRRTLLRLSGQILDTNCTLGKALTRDNITQLAALGGQGNSSINVVLTASDVVVDGFCMNVCGRHGAPANGSSFAYTWVGNPGTQCPGECAWPFAVPVAGPQNPPLVPPNGDVGIDGMAITLATLLAGVVTNPYDTGYYQGPPTFPLEAGTACTGIFGKGGFPGYPGELLVDKATNASYNVNGVNCRKFLVPAMWDPPTKQCVSPA